MRFVTKILLLFLLGVSFLAQNAQAQTVPASREQMAMSFSPLVKASTPAVVNIYTRKVVQQRLFSPFMNDPFFQRFFGGALPQGMTRERLESSLGSGVIVRPEGIIVTCNHVIAGADQITVALFDKREFEATVTVSDEKTDLAILKIDPKGEQLPFLELKDSDTSEVGDLVLAIGNPFGVGQTVTSGIVSALARTTLDINDLNYFIQTDAAINPGNSGGALIAMDGKLLGINSAIYSRSGGNMGIGFAIPSNMVQTALKSSLAGHKKIKRPWTGIGGQEVTGELATSLNMGTPSGLLVNFLHPASPAKKAGLKVGDVIVGLGGKKIEDPSAFRYRIATMPIGGTTELEILRAGQKTTLPLPLIEPPEVPARQETTLKGQHALAGLIVANLSPAVAEELDLQGDEKGIVVTGFSKESRAARLGLRVGDILLRLNGQEVASIAELQTALATPSRAIRLSFQRGGEVLTILFGS